MDRLILAAEATETTRQIFASQPFGARLATRLPFAIRLAFGDDATTLGTYILMGLAKHDIPGDVDGKGNPPSFYAAALKRGTLGPLKNVAQRLGASVLKRSGILQKYSTSTSDKALDKMIIALGQGKFDWGKIKTVGTVVHAVAQKLSWHALDVVRTENSRSETRRNMTPSDVDLFMGDPKSLARNFDRKSLARIERGLLTSPIFLANGEPRMWKWFSGQLNGLSNAQIASELDTPMAPNKLQAWVNDPTRKGALQKILAPLMDQYDLV